MSCILAIDIGTTSTKGLLVGSDGKVIFNTNIPYETHYPQPGYAEQSPADLLEAARKIILKAATEYKDQILGISFSCAMHSVIAVNENGEALTPVIIWADTRSSSEAKTLHESEVGKLIYQTTGTPVHPMSPLCKLMWLREYEKEIFNSAYKFVSIKEFILYHLSGEWLIDYSLASATGMFDIHQLKWMPEALKVAGINESKLSQCVSPYHKLNPLATRARELNLNADTWLIMGGSDGCLANLGSDVMDSTELSVTIGTSGAVRTTSKQYQGDVAQRTFNYRLDEEYFIIGGATNNGSALLAWFSENMLNEKPDAPAFVSRAMQIKEGSEGLIFLPYVMGERAPFYNPNACGVYFGLAQHHTHTHMMRALLEGICFELRSIAEAVEECTQSATRVVASGGFTRSAKWVQLLADILGKEVCVHDANDASSLGAAKIGFKALALPYNFAQSPKTESYLPNPTNVKIYDQYFPLFKELTASVMDKFDRITFLQNEADKN